MIHDPVERGRALGRFHAEVAPRLFRDLDEAGLLSDVARGRSREWDCFALYACVRGLVAAGGFNRETAAAIDALHATALAAWTERSPAGETSEARRALIAERYAEYGAIGQAEEASGPAALTRRLGEAAARHLAHPAPASPELIEMVGALHEALAEGASEAVRRGVTA